jgi:predicted RNA-binding protein with PUA-like domain
MNYWLLKTEPGTYSWSDLVKEKNTVWDGVRNFQARNNLKAMKKGDVAFIYHSGDDKAIIGTAKIIREAFPDPGDEAWTSVGLAPLQKLKRPVSLAEIKADKQLAGMTLVRAARLSVQPVKEQEYDRILKMSAE